MHEVSHYACLWQYTCQKAADTLGPECESKKARLVSGRAIRNHAQDIVCSTK